MDMLRRIEQLGSWSDDLVTPQCVWLPGLFNPTAYLTAVMQVCHILQRIYNFSTAPTAPEPCNIHAASTLSGCYVAYKRMASPRSTAAQA